MPKRKQKLKGVTFQLVHRSQQDPLAADENAPQRILVPTVRQGTKEDEQKRIEEQHKYGIYFDDDYNYLRYLKDSKDNNMEWPQHVEEELKKRKEQEKPKINLPSSVFASEVEEDVGMLNKAAPVSGPQLHLDPDIVAAMDDDFNYDDPENQLEDNFMALAQGIVPNEELSDADLSDSDVYSEEMDEVGSLEGSEYSFRKEETKSRFTEYSMTSSVVRRNEHLKLLDERFEKMFAQYDDDSLEASDMEETDGRILSSSDLIQLSNDLENYQKKDQLGKDNANNEITKRLVDKSSGEKEKMKYVELSQKEKWNCETALQQGPCYRNQPKMIMIPTNKIKVDKRTGIPMNVLGANKLTTKNISELNNCNKTQNSLEDLDIRSQLSVLSIRPKNETLEEKRNRKKAVKMLKNERKKEKRQNKEAFKEESKRQVKIAINNKNNVQGNKIL